MADRYLTLPRLVRRFPITDGLSLPVEAYLNAGEVGFSELFTTMPVVQLYTGNWLAGQPNLEGGAYADYAGIALEPEFLPDTPNHPEWWNIGGITHTGERYQHQILYKFVL